MRFRNSHVKRLTVAALFAAACLVIAAVLLLNSDKFVQTANEDSSAVLTAASSCDDFVRFIDVGQGDCALITSNGKSVLIDTGTPEDSNNLCVKLRKYGIRDSIDAIMLSHFHDDHSGGIDALTSRFSVSNLIFPDMKKSDSVLNGTVTAKKTVLSEGGELYIAKQGMTMKFGDCTVTILAYFADQESENERSVFAMADMHGKRFLFTGDSGKSSEKLLLKEGLDLKCDVLKVGHHGSNSSSSDDFLEACNPEYASISCGLGNMYSHPGESTLSRLEKHGIKFYRTDLNGDISFAVDENGIYPVTEK